MSQSERQVSGRTTDSRVQELKASAHLMTLDTGTFCLVNGSVKALDGQIAGVRVSVTDPQDPNVTVTSFRADGFLTGGGDSALIRVLNGPAQIMITIYQPSGVNENPPQLRVLRLSEAASGSEAAAAPAQPTPAVRRPIMVLTEPHDIIAHVQRMGDIGRSFGEWVGTPGSRLAIEGFSLTAPDDLEPSDLTYQAVLGRGWLSPWVESGQFCGSRGMALPILGLKLKLGAAAAKRYELRYSASFLDGTRFDDVKSEDACETPALAPLESLCITLSPKGAGKKQPATTAARAVTPQPVAKSSPRKAAAPVAKSKAAASAKILQKGSKSRAR